MRGVHWVAPKLVAEVSFTEWTADRRIRHPVFLGLREDKAAREVRIELAQPTARAAPASEQRRSAGVSLSNPDRVYFPDLGVTKRELAAYYEAVAERVLPGLANRPLTLLRCPEGVEGECFYQKHANQSVPEAVARVRVRRGEEPYAMVNDLAALVSLVQIGVLEFHVWGARADRLDRPDSVVFDIDPDAAVPWARVVETAVALRGLPRGRSDLAAFARVTGGKGVHVVVPLVRRASWDEVRDFSQGVAQHLVRLAPDRVHRGDVEGAAQGEDLHRLGAQHARGDGDRLLLSRARVRVRPWRWPLAWDELESLSAPLRESVREAPRRLAMPDPWATLRGVAAPALAGCARSRRRVSDSRPSRSFRLKIVQSSARGLRRRRAADSRVEWHGSCS